MAKFEHMQGNVVVEKELEKRLVVGFNGGIIILDGESFKPIHRFETDTTLVGKGSDGRHIFLINRENGYVKVVNVKSGEISPYELKGDKPTHVTSHHGRTAIFFDGSGVVQIFAENQLTTAEAMAPMTILKVAAHHGVAIPLGNGYTVASYTSPEKPAPLPTGIAIFNEAGEEVQIFDGHDGLHGSALAGTDQSEVVGFGAINELLLYSTKTNELTVLPLPHEHARVGLLTGKEGIDFLLGNYSSTANKSLGTNVSVINTIKKTLRLVDLGVNYSGNLFINEKNEGFVLGTDGHLYVIDVENAAVKTRISVVEPFELVRGKASPVMTVMGEYVYITEPVKHQLLQVEPSTQNIKVVQEIEFAATGLYWI